MAEQPGGEAGRQQAYAASLLPRPGGGYTRWLSNRGDERVVGKALRVDKIVIWCRVVRGGNFVFSLRH